MSDDNDDDALILLALTTAIATKVEMVAAGERQRIAECPRCGGSLRFALIGPKNHLRMFCRGNAADRGDTPHCGMNLME